MSPVPNPYQTLKKSCRTSCLLVKKDIEVVGISVHFYPCALSLLAFVANCSVILSVLPFP